MTVVHNDTCTHVNSSYISMLVWFWTSFLCVVFGLAFYEVVLD